MIGGYCIGAVIALAMAQELRARGREVGPLVVIDGVPENTGVAMRRWRPSYWLELMRNNDVRSALQHCTGEAIWTDQGRQACRRNRHA